MSVSQVKKRFREMESYLRNDTEGIRRLKLLKDDVNILRTSLSSAEEKAEQCEIVKNAARDRADSAESLANIASGELHSLRQKVASLERQLVAMEAKQNSESDDESQLHDIPSDESSVRSVLKSLRRKIPDCPSALTRTSSLAETTSVFDKADIIDGWSHSDLWSLGAFVSVIAEADGGVVVTSKKRLKDISLKTSGDESPMCRHFFQWFYKNNIDMDPSTEKAGFVRLTNTKMIIGTDNNDPRQMGGVKVISSSFDNLSPIF